MSLVPSHKKPDGEIKTVGNKSILPSGTASRYWNPCLETLPPETLLKIELANLRKIIRYAKSHAPLKCAALSAPPAA